MSAATPSATAALAPVIGYLAASDDYTEHERTELHGVTITDSTHGRVNNSAPEHELIWVGIYGEGRWMRPEEVLELAAALKHVAHAHIERVAKDQLARLSKANGSAVPVPHGWTAEDEAEFRAKSACIFEREQAAKATGSAA